VVFGLARWAARLRGLIVDVEPVVLGNRPTRVLIRRGMEGLDEIGPDLFVVTRHG
jgi:hypothetical protein